MVIHCGAFKAPHGQNPAYRPAGILILKPFVKAPQSIVGENLNVLFTLNDRPQPIP